MKNKTKQFIALFLVAALLNLFNLSSAIAASDTSTISATLNAGSLSVSAGDVTLAPVSVLTSAQTASNSTPLDISIADTTGSGAGWDLTMTTTNLAAETVEEIVDADGNDTITADKYDGTYGVTSPVKKYDVKITTGGAVATAIFQWRVDGGTWTNNVATAATVTLEKGLTITFPAGTYEVGDHWAVGVDVLLYDNGASAGLDVNTSGAAPTAVSGSTTDVTNTDTTAGNIPGTAATSDSITLSSAPAFRGMGSYTTSVTFTQNVQANPLAGTYTSTITLTYL